MYIYNLKISSPEDLSKRAFISITIDGQRYKEYNGNRINVAIKPNNAKTERERNQLLKQLEYEFRKRLEDGTYQRLIDKSYTVNRRVKDLMALALKQKHSSSLNRHYAKALAHTCNGFLGFLTEKERLADIHLLKVSRIQEYLNGFKATPTHYMNKRKELFSLLNYLKHAFGLDLNITKAIDRVKTKATLHTIYSQEQLSEVLAYLKEHHANLYLCCLISYGCFLRPHIEVRNLKGSHFKFDCTEIHLSGDENKSGRVRTVCLPDYVREAIYERVSQLGKNENLFSGNEAPFNEYYFKTAWSRHFKIMLASGIVENNQTIYSFRHTAAVNVYKQTKDLHLLQQLLGHSNMIVTLKYLRGLGVHSASELRQVMPKL